MWQSLRKQISTLREIINELAPIAKYGYSNSNCSSISISGQVRSLSSPSIVSPESVKISPVVAPSFRLVTGYYGISKEIFYGKNNPIFDKQKCTYGDDSWFVASQKYADVLGVADGVGGWRDLGVDPSKFSSSLMKQCKRLVEQDHMNHNPQIATSEQINEKTPVDILVESYQTLLESKDPTLIGSSTACIIVFNRESRLLHTANLGDSGFAIVRDNKIVHKSQEQCHYFNAPFQMAILPSEMQESGDSFNDKPDAAMTGTFELAEGDFVILGTDGVWDNLSEGLLLLQISKIQSYSLDDLQKAANEIVNLAAELSQDPDYLSPFAISARKKGINFRGGKPDDITVLLARVTKS